MALRYEPIDDADPVMDRDQQIAGALAATMADHNDRVNALINNGLIFSYSQQWGTVNVSMQAWEKLKPFQHGQFEHLMCRFLGLAYVTELMIHQIDDALLSD